MFGSGRILGARPTEPRWELELGTLTQRNGYGAPHQLNGIFQNGAWVTAIRASELQTLPPFSRYLSYREIRPSSFLVLIVICKNILIGRF